MTRVVGIDWATDSKNRAAVVLDVLDEGHLRVGPIASHLDDDEAGGLCENDENAVVAVDIPFGWPMDFASFVADWTPGMGAPHPPESERFRFRLTDRVVCREARKVPLPISADRIAMGARAWAALVARQQLGDRIDTAGTPQRSKSTVIEVYPGASARILYRRPAELGSPGAEPSYKRSTVTRRKVLMDVADRFDIDLDAKLDLLVGSDERSDEADAFLAAVTAAIYFAVCTGQQWRWPDGWRIRCPRDDDERSAAAREGWIFFPVPP